MKYKKLRGVKMRGQNGSIWFWLDTVFGLFSGMWFGMEKFLTLLCIRELGQKSANRGQMALKKFDPAKHIEYQLFTKVSGQGVKGSENFATANR